VSKFPDALRLDNVGVGSTTISQYVRFDGFSDRTFPTHYKVSVHVAGVSSAWCTSLQLDATDPSALNICHEELLPCQVYTGIGRFCQIALQTAYTLEIMYQTARTTFSVDGVQVDFVADTSGQPPQTVSIEFGNPSWGTGIVDYQNFVFTPLP
jgi:hypothetical protein